MKKLRFSRGTPRTAASLIVAALALTIFTFCPCNSVLAVGTGDDFNDNQKDVALWGVDKPKGGGLLAEKGGHLEYTVRAPSAVAYSIRPWVLEQFPLNSDWQAQVDVFNATEPSKDNQVNSFGLKVRNPLVPDTEVEIEFYISDLGGGPYRSGFYAEGFTDDVSFGWADTGDLTGLSAGAVRMVYDSIFGWIYVQYDIDPSDGYNWVTLGTFGILGTAGPNSIGVTDWSLTGADHLQMTLYGYSERMAIKPGQIYGDNFYTTGGVVPHDLAVTRITAPTPVPMSLGVTKQVKVQIQNRSPKSETITTLDGLVTLTAESLGMCSDAATDLHAGSPNKTLPYVLKSKARMDITFDVAFGCFNDTSKGAGHEDYRFIAVVHHDVLDGLTDTHAVDDVCPRSVTPPYVVDQNPDGKLKDKGCGGAKGDGTFGKDVKLDLFMK